MMMTIRVDVPSTRRRRMFHVLDEREQALWSGSTLPGAMEWLWEQGVTEARLERGGRYWKIDFTPEEE